MDSPGFVANFMADEAESFAAQGNWESAYRSVHSVLQGDDEGARSRARLLMVRHPEILNAGLETFSVKSLRNNIRMFEAMRGALASERLRLAQFKQIGTPEMYETAAENFRIVEREVLEGKLLSADDETRMKEERARDQKVQRIVNLVREASEAEASAVYRCSGRRACEKAFIHAQLYLNEVADMKIQVSTGAIVETYSPTDPLQIGGRVTMTPGKGEDSLISLKLFCRASPPIYVADEACVMRKTKSYSMFRDRIDRSMQSE